MTRTGRRWSNTPFPALLAWAIASCHQVGPLQEPMALAPAPPPPPSASVTPASPSPAPSADLAPTSRSTLAPVARASGPLPNPDPGSSSPGSRVVWTNVGPLRAAPSGVGPFLADVEAHLPPSMGTRYRDPQRVTWCHETTHGVHAALRIQYRLPAFYLGGGKCALVQAPAITLGDVAAVVPPRLRGTRFNTYLVAQRRDWDREPLYVWDEWVAYNNGTTTGIEEGARPGAGASDDAVACIELSGYALAVAAAARRKGVPVSEQFREFLARELRRSLALYARALAMPAFSWPDRRLEQAWRGGEPFVEEELRALYGDSLAVRDLLP